MLSLIILKVHVGYAALMINNWLTVCYLEPTYPAWRKRNPFHVCKINKTVEWRLQLDAAKLSHKRWTHMYINKSQSMTIPAISRMYESWDYAFKNTSLLCLYRKNNLNFRCDKSQRFVQLELGYGNLSAPLYKFAQYPSFKVYSQSYLNEFIWQIIFRKANLTQAAVDAQRNQVLVNIWRHDLNNRMFFAKLGKQLTKTLGQPKKYRELNFNDDKVWHVLCCNLFFLILGLTAFNESVSCQSFT